MLDKNLMKEAVERSHKDEKFNKLAAKYEKHMNASNNCLKGCGILAAVPLGLLGSAAMFGSSFFLAHKGDPTGLIFFELAGDVAVAPAMLSNSIDKYHHTKMLKLGKKLDNMVRENYIRCQIVEELYQTRGYNTEQVNIVADHMMKTDLTDRYAALEKDILEFEEQEDVYFSYRKFDDSIKSRLEKLKEEIQEKAGDFDFSAIVEGLENGDLDKFTSNFDIDKFHEFLEGNREVSEDEVKENETEEDDMDESSVIEFGKEYKDIYKDTRDWNTMSDEYIEQSHTYELDD